MDIKDYINMLKKNAVFILIITAVFALIAAMFTSSKPFSYQASTAIEISRFQSQKQSDVAYFQFDNFYAAEVAAAVSDNMIGFLSTASTVEQIYQRAGYEVPTSDLKGLGKTFTVKKKISTSAVIDVSYADKDQAKAGALIKTAADVIKTKVEQYNKNDSSAFFVANSDSPVIVKAPKPIAINAIIAGFIGLVLSWGIASIREALKK
ncbi:MAG: Wzz/FepE/Etk N-terminal domain-containing protein [Candidatus Berkelbacteria bacterium]|nr:Wzz/FepE/Etk N-terminal domain-containing protein [Candidatus Berkelbacteria bacterium]